MLTYEKYRWQIIGIIIFIVFQTLLISILMINLKKRKAGEKSLIESEERFRATFEQAAVGIAHVSPEGAFPAYQSAILRYRGIHRKRDAGTDISGDHPSG